MVAWVSVAYWSLPVATILVGAVLIYWLTDRVSDQRSARWFAAVLLAMNGWMALLVVHLWLTDPALQRAAVVVETAVGFLSFACWVAFVSVYTDAGYHRTRRFVGWAVAFVGGYLALAATNARHGWLYAGLPVRSEPVHYVGPEVAPGFVALAVVGLIPVGYSLYVLLVHLLTTQRGSELGTVLTLAGVVSVGAAEAAGELGVFPATGMHHAAYGVLPFQVLATFTLFRLRIFDVQPVARNAVVESLSDPIVLLDEAGRVVDFNPAAVERLGPLAEQVGDPLEAALPAVADRLTLPDGPEETASRVVVHDSGTERHYSVTVSPTDRDDGTGGWYAVVFRDVTAIERSRRRLRRQNDRFDQVASAISHDLRNPIQVADGYADLLDAELRSLADEADGPREDVESTLDDGLTYLDATTESLARMDEIVEDVLTLAREGRAVESTERVDLAAAARQAWQTVETGEATLRVDGDRVVEADPGRLRTVFENLFRNSVEHTDPGVTVTVTATDDGFAVADDGPGIPDDRVDEVFEYGYTTEDDGTGLGLAIVRTMVESHGWTVDVDEDAAGARFVVTCDPNGSTERPVARSSTGRRPSGFDPGGSSGSASLNSRDAIDPDAPASGRGGPETGPTSF